MWSQPAGAHPVGAQAVLHPRAHLALQQGEHGHHHHHGTSWHHYHGGHYSRSKRCKAPSVRRYKKAVTAFRKRYPQVRVFAPWNEANHPSQPTYRKPGLAVRYYKAVAG